MDAPIATLKISNANEGTNDPLIFSKEEFLIIESLFPILILPIPWAEFSRLSRIVLNSEYFCKNFLGLSPCSMRPNLFLKEFNVT